METANTGDVDKVTEQKMADLLGCTKRALEGRRLRGSIPEGVWMKHSGRIIYSKKRYDEWLESQWIYPWHRRPLRLAPAQVHVGRCSQE